MMKNIFSVLLWFWLIPSVILVIVAFFNISDSDILNNNRTIYVFRVDDFHFEDDSCQEQIIDLFGKYKIPLTIAVVPADKNKNVISSMSDSIWHKWTDKINAGKIEIAQHAYTHINNKEYPGNPREFYGLDYYESYKRIRLGKGIIDSLMIIHGVREDKLPVTFVFPCNFYEQEHIRAVKDCGLKIISANQTSPLSSDSISLYPCSTEDFAEVESINNTKIPTPPGLVVVLFHPYTLYDIKRSNYDISKLDLLLKKLTSNPNNSFMTIRDLSNIGVKSCNGAHVGLGKVSKRLFKKYRYYYNSISPIVSGAVNGFVYYTLSLIVGLACLIISKNRNTHIYIFTSLVLWVVFTTLSIGNMYYNDYIAMVISAIIPIALCVVCKIVFKKIL